MKKSKDKFKNLLKVCASLNITVTCLLIMFVLVFWGTLYQVRHGLYFAQKRFFESFVVMIFDVLPFPGGQMVMIILAVNLAAAAMVRFRYRWKYAGILLTHLGLILFLTAGFLAYQFHTEGNVSLAEGEETNVVTSVNEWELAAWLTENDQRKDIIAFVTTDLSPGDVLNFDRLGFEVVIEDYHPNSRFHQQTGENEFQFAAAPLAREPRLNKPQLLGNLRSAEKSLPLRLQPEARPFVTVDTPEGEAVLALRRRRDPLPFTIKLIEFRKAFHPGTQISRSYESEVEVTAGDFRQKTVISMNNPLRYSDVTVYQAAYFTDSNGVEHSTLAFARDRFRWFPYLASSVLCAGLLLHFTGRLFARRRSHEV